MLAKATKKGKYSHRSLLRDLSEIKAVLEVETQLVKELVRIAIARQTASFELRF
jgi:hypothetical protein